MSENGAAPTTVGHLPTAAGDDEPKFYAPPPALVENSNVLAYARERGFEDVESLRQWSVEHSEEFWTDMATRLIDWHTPFTTGLDDSNAPFYKWFSDGKLNIVHNALDRQVKTWRKNKVALIWESEKGDNKTYTYWQLYKRVNKFANVLKSMGVKKGDRVTIYLPRIPEIMIAMLACAKIGAMHSVVYGGFSVEALQTRIQDAQSRVVITADGGFLNGKVVELKKITDEAIRHSPVVEIVIVVKRTGHDVEMQQGRDLWYDDLMALPIASPKCETEPVDAEHPLYMLYTSGTTGTPKGLVHTHGGYQVGVATTMHFTFDIKEDDVWWCAADPGWVTGHSYIVYGPLILGATQVMYEGAPTFPYPNRWWNIVERYGVTILYTAPTAIRGLMRFGEAWPNRHDLSTLRLLGSVGEPINPEAWRWYHRVIGGGNCPIMDTWWQTETGSFMITPNPATPLKPGSGTQPFLGIDAAVVNEQGEKASDDEDGLLVIKKPWPSMLRTIYNNPDRYVEQYWSRVPGVYTAGDSARQDDDGYFWVIGRIDDVIKVSGYRLGTAEVESALVSHHDVAEAAAIGLPHEVKGNAIHTFVILKNGVEATQDLADELTAHVGKMMGPIAKPEAVNFVSALPKTRSGKIMRRVLKARALGLPEGDLSTLEA
ncbi:MAG TPA: acetate--CoA ligase [Herpetosiphonaceae bacterium]|nr:acetate--CoA ligase [Herpetosiphonaceae bacterium]